MNPLVKHYLRPLTISMKISLNWLADYVQLPPAEDLARKLTMAGLEIEAREKLGEGLEQVVVGQIAESRPHPDADKLSITKVDVGQGAPLQIVCGAKNYKVGDKIPVALVGAKLPGGMEIKQATLKKLQEKAAADRAASADKNKADGEKFLADNGKKPGIKTTDSGLEYEVLTEGKGDHPTATDKVTVNYKGTLIDGTTFDSSYDRGQPISFPLNGVIPCWTEGVQKMKVGGKARLVCTASIAYGESGRPGAIPGGATLVFEVELLAIQ